MKLKTAEFTPEALGIVTPEQCNRIRELLYQALNVSVSIAFDLPTGYVYVIVTYQDHVIIGGIDAEGVMST